MFVNQQIDLTGYVTVVHTLTVTKADRQEA